MAKSNHDDGQERFLFSFQTNRLSLPIVDLTFGENAVVYDFSFIDALLNLSIRCR